MRINEFRNPISNILLSNEDDYNQSLYISMLCTIAQYRELGTAQQEKFLKMLVEGSCSEKDLSYYMKKAIKISEKDYEDFVDFIILNDLKYYFLIDGIIIANLSKNKNICYEYCTEIFSLLDIPKEEASYIIELASIIMLNDINKITNIFDICPENCVNIDFGIYLKNAYDYKDIAFKLKRAEMLFDSYEIEELMPILKELSSFKIPKAMHMMGLIYEEGAKGIEKNKDLAENLYKQASDKGYYPSWQRIIWQLEEETELDRLKDEYDIVLSKLISMSDKGDKFASYEVGRALYNVNWFAINSIEIKSVTTDKDEAYKMAIKYLKRSPYVLCNYFLAWIYDNGYGVEKDEEMAFYHYMASANYGYGPSEYKVGLAYNHEYGVNEDEDKAFMYYKRAYEHGYKWATNNYGWCYGTGYGTNKDEKKAFNLYLEAAKEGNKIALHNVGLYYYHGTGVDVDREKAKKYLEESAALGYEDAKEKLNEYFLNKSDRSWLLNPWGFLEKS